MATARQWTLDEVHRLPDDGNRYELVRGWLFVTPSPSPGHEEILARLTEILIPYVAANGLGRVYARAVVRFEGSEVEPDRTVRQPVRGNDWDSAPTPILVVETLSRTTRQRDLGAKRQFYIDAGIAEYWIIDPIARQLRVVKAGVPDVVVLDAFEWRPEGASDSLRFRVTTLFED